MAIQNSHNNPQEKKVIGFQIMEEENKFQIKGNEPNLQRRESKNSQILKIIEDDQKKRAKSKFKPRKSLEHDAAVKPPSGKRSSLAQYDSESVERRTDSEFGTNRSNSKIKNDHPLVAKPSKHNGSSLNSSLNEIEYSKNFSDLVERVDRLIQDRRKLKIVPYSNKDRKKLLLKIEKYMVLMTKIMKHRKKDFKPIINDELFKKASKFHTEAINEKVKAKFLAYLIKEYGKNRELKLRSPAKKRYKTSRERSTSKPLSSKKHSPESYMINIVQNSNEKNKRKRKGSNISSDRCISQASNRMPRMKINTTDKKSKKKIQQNDNKRALNDGHILRQSSREIEDHFNTSRQQKANFKRRANKSSNKKKPKKQHAIDSDSDLNQSVLMTQGWGVKGNKVKLSNSLANDSLLETQHTITHLKSKRVLQITERLYKNKAQNKDRKLPYAPQQKSIKKKKTREWIGNKRNVSMGSQGSSEDGVWVKYL